MDLVVVLGAGELGGLIAHALAKRSVAPQICLVDEKGRVAEGKALDIMQAAPVEGFPATVTGSTDTARAGGATVVVIADQFGGGEFQGDAALAVLKRLRDFSPTSLVVCAGAMQRELIERGVRELHVPRQRILGSAPEALVSGVRAIVAAELRTSPRDVAVTALGVPPDQIVVPWEDATAGGFAVSRLIGEPERRRLEAGLGTLWPPGPYALASAAAKVIDTVLGRSERVVSCFVAPDGAGGLKTRTAALPVRLNRNGVVDVVMPELNGRDRVRLDNALLL
jgi:malate dehydrogenase